MERGRQILGCLPRLAEDAWPLHVGGRRGPVQRRQRRARPGPACAGRSAGRSASDGRAGFGIDLWLDLDGQPDQQSGRSGLAELQRRRQRAGDVQPAQRERGGAEPRDRPGPFGDLRHHDRGRPGVPDQPQRRAVRALGPGECRRAGRQHDECHRPGLSEGRVSVRR